MDYNQKKELAIEKITEFKTRLENDDLGRITDEEILRMKKLGKQFGLTSLIKDI